jgi:hypothetical protein
VVEEVRVRFLTLCAWCATGINFIWYGHRQKIARQII